MERSTKMKLLASYCVFLPYFIIFLSPFASPLFQLEFYHSDTALCNAGEEKVRRRVVFPGDVMIGALFPLTGTQEEGLSLRENPQLSACIKFSERRFRWFMVMVFAIIEINNNSTLIPNTTLGYVMYDTCLTTNRLVNATLTFLGKSRQDTPVDSCTPQVIIGEARSGFSSIVSRFISLYHIPQISYTSSCKCLSNKKEYPSFLRTIPSDAFQATAIARLVNYFGWPFVGTIEVDDHYGREGISQFLLEAEPSGLCIAFRKIIPKEHEGNQMRLLGETLESTKVTVIVVFTGDSSFRPFVNELILRNISKRTWIASEAWVSSSMFAMERYAHIFQGTIGFALRKARIPGLENFLKKLKPDGTEESLITEFDAGTLQKDMNIIERTDLSTNDMNRLTNQIEMMHSSSCNNVTVYTHRESKDKINEIDNYDFKEYVHDVAICDNDLLTSILRNETILVKKSQRKLRFEKWENDYDKFRWTQTNNSTMGDKRNKQPLNVFMMDLWRIIFNCTWDEDHEKQQPCSGFEQLNSVDTTFTDVSQLRVTYNTYMAVYAYANALHDLQLCVNGRGPFSNGTCADGVKFQPWELLYYLWRVRYINNVGETITFDENGDPPAIYELVNWQTDNTNNFYIKVVGSFDSSEDQGSGLRIDTNKIMWNSGSSLAPRSICSESCLPGTRKVARKGEPFCCFDCVSCNPGEFSSSLDSQDCYRCKENHWSNEQRDTCLPMPEEYLTYFDAPALILLAFASLGLIIIVNIFGLLFWHRNSSAMKSRGSWWISGIILCALAGCLVNTVNYPGEPGSLPCRVRESLAFTLLTLTIVCILQQTVSLMTVATSLSSSSRNEFIKYFEKFCILICMGPQLAFTIMWIIYGYSEPTRNSTIQPGIIILECSGASLAWAMSALVYLGILAAVCLALANVAQNKSSTANDAKFVIFSILIYFVVLLAFVPAYNSTRGKLSTATEMFGIIATAYGFLGCLFIPKCYYILKARDISKM